MKIKLKVSLTLGDKNGVPDHLKSKQANLFAAAVRVSELLILIIRTFPDFSCSCLEFLFQLFMLNRKWKGKSPAPTSSFMKGRGSIIYRPISLITVISYCCKTRPSISWTDYWWHCAYCSYFNALSRSEAHHCACPEGNALVHTRWRLDNPSDKFIILLSRAGKSNPKHQGSQPITKVRDHWLRALTSGDTERTASISTRIEYCKGNLQPY